MGKIKLEGIEVMARIGLLEEELFAPQDLARDRRTYLRF